MEGTQDRPEGGRKPVRLLVRLPYETADALVERFGANVTRTGIFIHSRDPKPVGTELSFELRLASGAPALRGEGVVRWIRPAGEAAPTPAPGMGVQFTRLDDASGALVERMVAARERREPGPPGPQTTPARATPGAPPSIAPRATPQPAVSTAPTVSVPAVPAQRSPAQADLALPHRVEQLSAAPARIDLGLPETPARIARRSRAVIGIDLGTTNSCAAVVKDGRPYVIPSREGHNTVPSIVALNARHRIVVGHLAKAQLLTNPRDTVHGAKRLMGRAYDSPLVRELRSKFPYEIVPGEDGQASVRLGPATLALEQVSALILREVKEVAQNHLGEEVNRAVVTVPAYYNERQRAAVRRAGALAGLHVERILNEPTAAALAYAFGRHLTQRVLVYDLGGGTFDASVLELQDNLYEVVSTGGDTFLGGVDFDHRIVERLLAAYERQHGEPFTGDRVALSRLVDAAERAKCALSERTEFAVQLPFIAIKGGRPATLDATLSREEIVGLVEPLVDRTLEVCRDVLAARNLAPSDIDDVILVGGQSRMPLVHEKVAAFFGRAPSRSVHPDEAVAVGAALLAESLGSADGVVLIDVLPMSIGIGLPGGRVKTILERNTPLPARKQYGLATTRDGQTEFELVVLQGEGATAGECEYLGTVQLTGLPAGPRGMVKIAVTFELGAECLLTVTARELNTGRQVQAVLSAREGAEAARRKLGGTAPHARPAPRAGAATAEERSVTMPLPVARPAPTPPASRVGSLLRRLLGGGRAPSSG